MNVTRVVKIGNVVMRIKTLVLAMIVCTGCANMTYLEYPPEMPIPLEPVGGSVVINQTDARFIWRAAAEADHYDFHIFNRANSDIRTYYLSDLSENEICAGGLCEVTVELLLPIRKGHAWRVRAGNYAGKSAWTRTEFEASN